MTTTTAAPARSQPGGVPEVARHQGGVFTAAQAREEGWTDRVVRRRIATKRWVYVAGQALAGPKDRWTAFQLATAAQLTLPNAVISHRTAALLHGFPIRDQEQTCDVILTVNRRGGRAINTHRLRLDPADVEAGISGLWVTTAYRTALDCLATIPLPAALDLWAWVSTRRILDSARLEQAIGVRKNWYGTGQLKQLAGLVAGGGASGAEFCFMDLLRQAGIRGWTPNAPIEDDVGPVGVADVLFPAELVVIESDGFHAHSSRRSFVNDRRRQNRLIAAGYLVLRFTWDDLVHRPTEVIAEVRQALRARSARLI